MIEIEEDTGEELEWITIKVHVNPKQKDILFAKTLG